MFRTLVLLLQLAQAPAPADSLPVLGVSGLDQATSFGIIGPKVVTGKGYVTSFNKKIPGGLVVLCQWLTQDGQEIYRKELPIPDEQLKDWGWASFEIQGEYTDSMKDAVCVFTFRTGSGQELKWAEASRAGSTKIGIRDLGWSRTGDNGILAQVSGEVVNLADSPSASFLVQCHIIAPSGQSFLIEKITEVPALPPNGSCKFGGSIQYLPAMEGATCDAKLRLRTGFGGAIEPQYVRERKP